MKRTKRFGTFLKVFGTLLIAASITLWAYNHWDDFRAQTASDAVLLKLDEITYSRSQEKKLHDVPTDGAPPDMTPDSEADLDPNRDMPTVLIDDYLYIGTLTIPALEIQLPVMDDWDYPRMRIAPCRYSGTVYLDNMVICGHNYNTHFGRLDKLQKDDLIVFTDVDGEVYNYRVAETEVVMPTEVEQMITGDWDLTLFTCNYSGRARVAVRCRREAR